MSNFIKGTMILTVSIFISKILGFIYIVPFKALVGTKGYVLYNYAYQAYIVFLSLTTMGIPMAVSKYVSKYNELGEHHRGIQLFRSGLKLMLATGIISCTLLYLLAPRIALIVIDPNDPTGNSIEDVVFVIRMVSFALLIIPAMGIIRGYFQGHHFMTPTAVSQVVEQIVRIVFILIGGFLVLKVWKGTLSVAVGLATFGAFVGGLGGMATLIYYWRKRNTLLAEAQTSKTPVENIGLIPMYKEILSYAIPFIFIGLAIPMYNVIDTFTINKALMNIGFQLGQAEQVNGIIGLVQKVILVPVALATAMSLTLIPIITKAYTSKDKQLLQEYISQAFMVILYLTLPVILFIAVLSYPVYHFLFVTEVDIGGHILRWFIPTALFFALFSVSSSILQGMNLQRQVLISLSLGIIIKGISNVPLIMLFKELGPIIATNLGFAISIGFNFFIIHRSVQGLFKPMLSKLRKILVHSSFILVVLVLIQFVHDQLSMTESYLHSVLLLTVAALITGSLYIFMGIKSNLIFVILGHRLPFLQRFKREKKEE